MRTLFSFVVGLLTCTSAYSADHLNAGKEVFKSADWSVRQTPDLLTGKMGCTALYRDAYQVLLTDNGLFISLAAWGGLKGYSIRFNEEAASADRVVTPFERDIQSIVLKDLEYSKLLASKNLRVRVQTASEVTVEQEIDLAAIKNVNHAIVSAKGCR